MNLPIANLVGRDHELNLIREKWTHTKQGNGQIVMLSGIAGIGKSQMLDNFRSSLAEEVRNDLLYQCSAAHTHSAFQPVIQQLRRQADFATSDSGDVKLNKLENLLRALKEDVMTAAPLFASLLSLPGSFRYGRLNLTPQQLRSQTIEMFIKLVLRLSNRKPVLCVIEDAHWMDPSMRDCILDLIPQIANQAVLLLITYRPEGAPSWSGHSQATYINLKRLEQKQAAEIAKLAGGLELMDTTVERIVAQADGVPLYVEELTKSVLESYSALTESVSDQSVPASLQESVISRLNRLNNAKELTQIAAAIGPEFSYEMLVAVSGTSHKNVKHALDQLVESGLLFCRGTPPNATYTFKHSLVQDTAYSSLPNNQKQHIHGLILGALEKQANSNAAERIETLAHHAFHGEDWEKAFDYLQRAGSKAMDNAAIREAVAQYERALDAYCHLPESPKSQEREIDLRFDLRNALWSLGEFEQILEHLKHAEQLAYKLGDLRRVGWSLVFRSASLWQLGRSGEALSSAENAVSINNNAKDLSLEIGANFYLGCATITSGNCQRAETYFQKIVDSLVGDLSRDRCGLPFIPYVVARSWLVWSLAERGEFEKGKIFADEALAVAKEVDHPFNLAHIYYDLGYYYIVKGEFEQAVTTLEQAYYYVDEWKLTYLSPFIMGFLGHAEALSGKVETGLTHLQQAVSDYNTMGLGLFRSLVTIQLGEALFLANRIEDASAVIEQGLTLARKRGEAGHQAHALRLLGKISLQTSEANSNHARQHFEEASQLAQACGMQPMFAHCNSELAELCARESLLDEAENHASTAAKLYRDMGMTNYLEQADLKS